MFRHVPILAALFACFGSFGAGAAEKCDGPEAVCRFAPYVMKLEGNRREANAIYLGVGLADALPSDWLPLARFSPLIGCLSLASARPGHQPSLRR